ncbi:MAG: apolipoprotein N-acyltransferase, partial [Acetobacteraceae bacterium]|nr:apolipoprotein N-acyltransferase [Acetobacteraceae bacterium]
RPRPLLGGALALALLAGFGAWRLGGAPAAATDVAVLLVQGNVEQSLKWAPEERMAIFERYLRLTRTGLAEARGRIAEGTRLVVVWPETASPFLLAQDPEARRMVAAVLEDGGATLLAGTVRAEWGPGGRLARVFNSLVALDEAGEVVGLYDKAHLVPFGEYMPLSGLLPVRLAAGGMDFTAGPGPVTLEPPGVPPFGALICYEVIFPGAVVPSPRPAWLVNITNDAWFGHSAGPWQHLAAARLRAVEEGLPLARAAQTGISTLFDGRGVRGPALSLGVEGTLLLPLPPALPPTAFTHLGVMLPSGLSIFVVLLGASLGRRRPRDAHLASETTISGFY